MSLRKARTHRDRPDWRRDGARRRPTCPVPRLQGRQRLGHFQACCAVLLLSISVEAERLLRGRLSARRAVFDEDPGTRRSRLRPLLSPLACQPAAAFMWGHDSSSSRLTRDPPREIKPLPAAEGSRQGLVKSCGSLYRASSRDEPPERPILFAHEVELSNPPCTEGWSSPHRRCERPRPARTAWACGPCRLREIAGKPCAPAAISACATRIRAPLPPAPCAPSRREALVILDAISDWHACTCADMHRCRPARLPSALHARVRVSER